MTCLELREYAVQCPYCGARNQVLIDCSVAEQAYQGDCSLCCRPMEFLVTIAAGHPVQVRVRREDD